MFLYNQAFFPLVALAYLKSIKKSTVTLSSYCRSDKGIPKKSWPDLQNSSRPHIILPMAMMVTTII